MKRMTLADLSPKAQAEYMQQWATVKHPRTVELHNADLPEVKKPTRKRTPPDCRRWFVLNGLPEPLQEYRFDPARRWRFDYAWPQHWVALEVEGGIWTGGRHTRGTGFLKDMEKYNRAVLLGWRVLRTTPDALKEHQTAKMICEAIGGL